MDRQGKFEMVAKTLFGLESVLEKEILALGGEKVEILNRAVRFFGDKTLLYKSNLYLRTALRILIPVQKVSIKTQDDFYDRLREFEWEKYLKIGNTFAVDTFLDSEIFTNSYFVSLRTKDAIADRFREKFRRRPSVNTENPNLIINVHLVNHQLTVSVDSSGASLHKRGYRLADGVAPLNEVLAAGMIQLTGWDGTSDFYDPMCGSGTIGIEAALLARDIPPGVFRKKFSFEFSPDFDSDLWEDIFDNIQEKEWEGRVFASDVSRKAILISRSNAKNASVHKNIEYKEGSFEGYDLVENGGVAILNPPYGERMAKTEINHFYNMIGNVLKKSFLGTQAWIVSSNFEALKHVGLKPSGKYKLYNGALECRYHRYEIYAGSKKNKLP